MNRRDALQALAASAATPILGAATVEHLFEIVRAARQGMLRGSAALRTLTPMQAQSTRAIAEIIIPATDTPGAGEARVAEFIDSLLTDWMDSAERDAFIVGLQDLDARAQAQFGAPFANCLETRQIQMVAAMDAEVTELLAADRAAPRDPYDVGNRPDRQAPGHFFYQMKRWTLVGYFTSEIGMTQELRHNFLPGEWDPCRVLEEA